MFCNTFSAVSAWGCCITNLLNTYTVGTLPKLTAPVTIFCHKILAIAHEATRFGGFGGELVATVQEECFWHLEAPVLRVAGWDTPYPHAFEWEYFPGQARVVSALQATMEAS